MAELLRVENIAKRFGAIVATDDLTFSISERELHAVIRPHRQLELAMALASKPRMLLLDEPMAGLGPEESARMVAILRELKKELTILLVEHDMEVVFALADRIAGLVYGRVIASGKPEEIRSNAQVRDAYLGEQEAVHG
jgi:branched-chain amino acid transport system ATP-binding protein